MEKIDNKILEATKEWVRSGFSTIPVYLLMRAYEDSPEDIYILAPSFEKFKEGFKRENCTDSTDKENPCKYCDGVDCETAYHDENPLFPMWGWVFVPDNMLDKEWIYENADKVAECGFIVYETDEIGVYLGINGIGYDFYKSHWVPLYLERGLKWHEH